MVVQGKIAVFSILWMYGILGSAFLVGTGYLLWAGVGERRREQLRPVLALVILCEIAITHSYLAFIANMWTLADSLPLHLCRLSHLLNVFALLTKRQLLYEWSIYLGLPSGLNAILTPQMAYGYTPYLVFEFYFAHSLLILVPILLTAFYSMVPRRTALLWVFALGNLVAAIVFSLNYILGSNYMYLARKPVADSPFLIGPWPGYIVGIEVIGCLHMVLIDLFFRVGVRRMLGLARETVSRGPYTISLSKE